MAEMVLRNARWPTRLCATARVRYDKTTDAISDRSPHKYAGYLTPLLPIAAASPDCQPRPLATPQKPPLLFPDKIQVRLHAEHKHNTKCPDCQPPKPTLHSPSTPPPYEICQPHPLFTPKVRGIRGNLWGNFWGNF